MYCERIAFILPCIALSYLRKSDKQKTCKQAPSPCWHNVTSKLPENTVSHLTGLFKSSGCFSLIELDEVFDRKSIKRDEAARQLQSAEGSRAEAFYIIVQTRYWKWKEAHLLSQQLLLIQQVVTLVTLRLTTIMRNLWREWMKLWSTPYPLNVARVKCWTGRCL